MRIVTTDVDIDCCKRDELLSGLDHVIARIEKKDGPSEKHTTGVYFQNIPKNPITGISTVDYKSASNFGFFKIDFLNVNFYEGVRDEQHLDELMNREPEWEFLLYPSLTDQLFHLNGYSGLLKRYTPTSVEELAMILAIIRPSKAYLQQSSWERIKEEVWVKVDDSYQFKRSHAISYSLAIIVHLNLLIENMMNEERHLITSYLRGDS